jgi:hypothetical protein
MPTPYLAFTARSFRVGKGLDFTERNELLRADANQYVFVAHAQQGYFLAGTDVNGFA